ncbi:MAG: hypothetical protein DHS80DRAFT_21488 [Piptocephalis tieghemiana]|nr:MAG: hypothetical protein DHS80DRAFT_21488 [Piptocephalis tieghemiana]
MNIILLPFTTLLFLATLSSATLRAQNEEITWTCPDIHNNMKSLKTFRLLSPLKSTQLWSEDLEEISKTSIRTFIRKDYPLYIHIANGLLESISLCSSQSQPEDILCFKDIFQWYAKYNWFKKRSKSVPVMDFFLSFVKKQNSNSFPFPPNFTNLHILEAIKTNKDLLSSYHALDSTIKKVVISKSNLEAQSAVTETLKYTTNLLAHLFHIFYEHLENTRQEGERLSPNAKKAHQLLLEEYSKYTDCVLEFFFNWLRSGYLRRPHPNNNAPPKPKVAHKIWKDLISRFSISPYVRLKRLGRPSKGLSKRVRFNDEVVDQFDANVEIPSQHSKS